MCRFGHGEQIDVLVLVDLSCYSKNTRNWVGYKQQAFFFFLSSGGLRPTIRLPADLVSGSDPLSGYSMSIFL